MENYYRKRERISLILFIILLILAIQLPGYLNINKKEIAHSIPPQHILKLDSIVAKLDSIDLVRKEKSKYKSYSSKKYNPRKYSKSDQSNYTNTHQAKKNETKFTQPAKSNYKKEFDNSGFEKKGSAFSDHSNENPQNMKYRQDSFKTDHQKKEYTYVLDLNTASQMELESLKGIGPTLAKRILKFREGLGGFHSVDQIKDTYGLPIETFTAITDQLRVETPQQKIDVNIISEQDLVKHSLFSYNEAKWIVAFREQHGPYLKMNDLLKIRMLNPEKIELWEPYLALSEVTNSDGLSTDQPLDGNAHIGQE